MDGWRVDSDRNRQECGRWWRFTANCTMRSCGCDARVWDLRFANLARSLRIYQPLALFRTALSQGAMAASWWHGSREGRGW